MTEFLEFLQLCIAGINVLPTILLLLVILYCFVVILIYTVCIDMLVKL